jgi:hypothetical protein
MRTRLLISLGTSSLLNATKQIIRGRNPHILLEHSRSGMSQVGNAVIRWCAQGWKRRVGKSRSLAICGIWYKPMLDGCVCSLEYGLRFGTSRKRLRQSFCFVSVAESLKSPCRWEWIEAARAALVVYQTSRLQGLSINLADIVNCIQARYKVLLNSLFRYFASAKNAIRQKEWNLATL